jgi:quercetin dioxygenase-like cupin family protein
MTRIHTLTCLAGAGMVALLSGDLIRAQSAAPSSNLIGRATFEDPFKVKRVDKSLDWEVVVKAKPSLDIAVQTIDFPIDSQSTWHVHPGPVFISVVQGAMTFYESDDPNCEPTVLEQGQGFLDVGDHAHIARNESGAPARNVVVYLVPAKAPALRIDQPNPGNCAFRGF